MTNAGALDNPEPGRHAVRESGIERLEATPIAATALPTSDRTERRSVKDVPTVESGQSERLLPTALPTGVHATLAMTSAARRTRRAVLRGVAYLASCLLVLEVGLQVAGLVAPALLARRPPHRTPGDAGDVISILCVGDSHTYGAPLPVEESYPAQLEALLGRRYPGRRFALANLGVPGVNTAYVANRLERQLLELRPHLVIVWVGVNNAWNAIETDAWTVSDPWLALRRLALRVKLVRLATILWHGRSERAEFETQVDGRFAVPWRLLPVERRAEQLRGDALERGIEIDMGRMASTARARDTPILFVNYPVPFSVVPIIHRVGEKLGVPVLETFQELTRAMANGHDDSELMMMAAGPHPRGLLYAYVAEAMVPWVVTALRDRHGIALEETDRR